MKDLLVAGVINTLEMSSIIIFYAFIGGFKELKTHYYRKESKKLIPKITLLIILVVMIFLLESIKI